jgi:photosystem II stability/assembly factor-like uncharacterized protein
MDVHFVDAQTGWAVGDAGTILKTSNGGSSWSSQTSGTNQGLSSVYFTDAQTGWAVGKSGTIVRTINGGINSESYPDITTNNLYSVHFFTVKQAGPLERMVPY